MSALLKRGDRVRVIAPGGALPGHDALASDGGPFERGLDVLVAAGLEPVVGSGIQQRDRYFAGTEARRLEEFQTALADQDARAIWVARGGYGASHVLPHVPVERVRATGKCLIGFSDVSALHALWGRAQLPSVHGANVVNLAAWQPAHRDELLSQLLNPTPEPVLFQAAGALGKGTVEGPVTGGNLTVLASLAGTGFLPSWRDAILFIEDVGERPYRLDRCLTQLQQAGALQGVRAVCVGQLTDCDDKALDYTALDMVLAFLAKLKVPVLHGLPLGHDPSSRAIPFGTRATLNPAALTLTLHPALTG